MNYIFLLIFAVPGTITYMIRLLTSVIKTKLNLTTTFKHAHVIQIITINGKCHQL